MAVLAGKLLLILAIYLAGKAQVSATFGIIEPFPENIYPIEYTSAEVTCVASDEQDGTVIPESIKFMRKSKLAKYEELKPGSNLIFTNRTEDEGRKLYVTMEIKNVTRDDDSLFGALGRYECHAFAVGGDPAGIRHGFSVNVITKGEIPTVVVPTLGALEHASDVILTCNMTARGNKFATTLKRISWYKDGVQLQSVRNPDPTNPEETIGPLEVKNIGVRDGGTYLCLLQVLLRNIKKYNVSAETTINVTPWLDKPAEEVEQKNYQGKDASFECVAQGFPLEVEWKVKKKGEDKVQACINSSTSDRYSITRSGIYQPYHLTISDVQYTDRGVYYCCLPDQCSDNVDKDCQPFILRVRDPLGALWPVIGILVEAILLFLIIFLTEKRKQKKEGAEREDGRMEFSYSSTDDGERGQVRLRKTGEPTNA